MTARVWTIGALAALGLASCGTPAATPERESEAAATTESTASPSTAANDDDRGGRREGRGERGGEPDTTPAPALAETHADGAPSWASNRRRTAAQAAQRQFEQNGSDFGAATREAYIDAAHAFIRNPPSGLLTATRRNGDRLMYDPAGNVFVVATREGAPRTMFKPREGMAYWREQEQRIADGGSRQANRPAADE